MAVPLGVALNPPRVTSPAPTSIDLERVEHFRVKKYAALEVKVEKYALLGKDDRILNQVYGHEMDTMVDLARERRVQDERTKRLRDAVTYVNRPHGLTSRFNLASTLPELMDHPAVVTERLPGGHMSLRVEESKLDSLVGVDAPGSIHAGITGAAWSEAAWKGAVSGLAKPGLESLYVSERHKLALNLEASARKRAALEGRKSITPSGLVHGLGAQKDGGPGRRPIPGSPGSRSGTAFAFTGLDEGSTSTNTDGRRWPDSRGSSKLWPGGPSEGGQDSVTPRLGFLTMQADGVLRQAHSPTNSPGKDGQGRALPGTRALSPTNKRKPFLLVSAADAGRMQDGGTAVARAGGSNWASLPLDPLSASGAEHGRGDRAGSGGALLSTGHGHGRGNDHSRSPPHTAGSSVGGAAGWMGGEGEGHDTYSGANSELQSLASRPVTASTLPLRPSTRGIDGQPTLAAEALAARTKPSLNMGSVTLKDGTTTSRPKSPQYLRGLSPETKRPTQYVHATELGRPLLGYDSDNIVAANHSFRDRHQEREVGPGYVSGSLASTPSRAYKAGGVIDRPRTAEIHDQRRAMGLTVVHLPRVRTGAGEARGPTEAGIEQGWTGTGSTADATVDLYVNPGGPPGRKRVVPLGHARPASGLEMGYHPFADSYSTGALAVRVDAPLEPYADPIKNITDHVDGVGPSISERPPGSRHGPVPTSEAGKAHVAYTGSRLHSSTRGASVGRPYFRVTPQDEHLRIDRGRAWRAWSTPYTNIGSGPAAGAQTASILAYQMEDADSRELGFGLKHGIIPMSRSGDGGAGGGVMQRSAPLRVIAKVSESPSQGDGERSAGARGGMADDVNADTMHAANGSHGVGAVPRGGDPLKRSMSSSKLLKRASSSAGLAAGSGLGGGATGTVQVPGARPSSRASSRGSGGAVSPPRVTHSGEGGGALGITLPPDTKRRGAGPSSPRAGSHMKRLGSADSLTAADVSDVIPMPSDGEAVGDSLGNVLGGSPAQLRRQGSGFSVGSGQGADRRALVSRGSAVTFDTNVTSPTQGSLFSGTTKRATSPGGASSSSGVKRSTSPTARGVARGAFTIDVGNFARTGADPLAPIRHERDGWMGQASGLRDETVHTALDHTYQQPIRHDDAAHSPYRDTKAMHRRLLGSEAAGVAGPRADISHEEAVMAVAPSHEFRRAASGRLDATKANLAAAAINGGTNSFNSFYGQSFTSPRSGASHNTHNGQPVAVPVGRLLVDRPQPVGSLLQRMRAHEVETTLGGKILGATGAEHNVAASVARVGHPRPVDVPRSSPLPHTASHITGTAAVVGTANGNAVSIGTAPLPFVAHKTTPATTIGRPGSRAGSPTSTSSRTSGRRSPSPTASGVGASGSLMSERSAGGRPGGPNASVGSLPSDGGRPRSPPSPVGPHTGLARSVAVGAAQPAPASITPQGAANKQAKALQKDAPSNWGSWQLAAAKDAPPPPVIHPAGKSGHVYSPMGRGVSLYHPSQPGSPLAKDAFDSGAGNGDHRSAADVVSLELGRSRDREKREAARRNRQAASGPQAAPVAVARSKSPVGGNASGASRIGTGIPLPRPSTVLWPPAMPAPNVARS